LHKQSAPRAALEEPNMRLALVQGASFETAPLLSFGPFKFFVLYPSRYWHIPASRCPMLNESRGVSRLEI